MKLRQLEIEKKSRTDCQVLILIIFNQFLLIVKMSSVILQHFLYIFQQINNPYIIFIKILTFIPMQKSSFILIVILINFIFASNSVSTWNSPPVTCTDASGVNIFNPKSGSQTFFAATKVLQTVDSNIAATFTDPVTEYTTVYFAYFIQNPSAGVYNLIIQVTNSKTGVVTSHTQSIQSDQTLVMARGGMAVMRQGSSFLNFYQVFNGAISQIISLPSTDRLFTSQIVQIVRPYNSNQFGFLYYDSNTLNLYPSRWHPAFTSTGYRTDQATITGIPAASTFIFSKYILLQIVAADSIINLYDMVSGSIDLVKRGTNALSSMSDFYFGHIFWISLSGDIFAAMYDQTYANSHLFELRQTNNGAVLANSLKSQPNVANALKPFTDSKTAFVQVDTTGMTVAFYFVNTIDFGQFGFFYVVDSSSLADHYTQVVADFETTSEVSFSFDGSFTSGSLFSPTLQVFLLKSGSIVRYTIAVALPSGGSPSYTINKDFQVSIGADLQTALSDNTPGTFQLTMNIGCICTSKTMVRFICFSGTQCSVVVQNSSVDCSPV